MFTLIAMQINFPFKAYLNILITYYLIEL